MYGADEFVAEWLLSARRLGGKMDVMADTGGTFGCHRTAVCFCDSSVALFCFAV